MKCMNVYMISSAKRAFQTVSDTTQDLRVKSDVQTLDVEDVVDAQPTPV